MRDDCVDGMFMERYKLPFGDAGKVPLELLDFHLSITTFDRDAKRKKICFTIRSNDRYILDRKSNTVITIPPPALETEQISTHER